MNVTFLKMTGLVLFITIFSFHLQSQDTLKTFIFGHSLIHHEYQVNPTPSQETSVPHWFHFLAREAGRDYAVSGQYGFLITHANNLPPFAQWGFDSVAGAWDSDLHPFSFVDFDNILITPGNFMQWQPPGENYPNEELSPVSATNIVFDWVNQQEDQINFYVYENWPDMAPFLASGFPPSQSEWNGYNDYLNGDFHDWFLEYHDALITGNPDNCVSMIPVGPVLSSLFSLSPFDEIPVDVLYEDDAPHGRPTVYFLAALVTYMAMYEEPAQLNFEVPGIIDPIVAENYSAAVNNIWNALQEFVDDEGNTRVFCGSPSVSTDNATGLNSSLKVFPNPTSGKIDILGVEAFDQIELFDITGKKILQLNPGNDETDLENLANGLYFVKANNLLTGSSRCVKLIKQ
ncbi:MAG: T9SS C-terminal target domain-containing protein [Bacteroidetes bacterium]|nr:MAG: T9SS C-terminal target domain-containing protein [Bacteroidota bacterium]